MKKSLIALCIPFVLMALHLGEKPKTVVIEDERGGRVDGLAWSSDTIRDKVYVLFYVDPDEKSTNEEVTKRLKEEAFDRSRYGSIAIINMAATWMPNFAIESTLKSKQKEFPHTIYVKDKRKVLVKEWGLQDDSSDVLLFDKDGKLLFIREGKLSDSDIETLIKTIREHI